MPLSAFSVGPENGKNAQIAAIRQWLGERVKSLSGHCWRCKIQEIRTRGIQAENRRLLRECGARRAKAAWRRPLVPYNNLMRLLRTGPHMLRRSLARSRGAREVDWTPEASQTRADMRHRM